jgi:hypothetical protein
MDRRGVYEKITGVRRKDAAWRFTGYRSDLLGRPAGA